MADRGQMENEGDENSTYLPTEIRDWSKHHVKHWALNMACVEGECADILLQQNINGPSLLLLEKSDLLEVGVTLGPAKLIIHKRDELLKLKKEQLINPTSNQSGRPCKPYPFHRHHDACRYKVNSVLDVTESGASDYIEPCHEYKGYINTSEATAENKMKKFTDEVIRFAAACMNSRTNGTIHFGVGDKPEFIHGQVLGVSVQDKEAYVTALPQAIEGHFEHKHIPAAKMCIKPPRFVEVLNPDMTSTEKFVIEVDIVPESEICKENIYHIFSLDTRKSKKKVKSKETEKEEMKRLFIRDHSSSRDLLAPTTFAKPLEEYNRFLDSVSQLSLLRKQAEEKHLRVVKSSVQGSRLSEMITGGSQSLDKSNYERYVIVTNKSHLVQLESLEFLLELNPTAVLDFDPETTKSGLKKHFEDKSTINVHLPVKYKITEAVEDIACKLKLTRNISWILCNGGIEREMPSEVDDWLIEKGASVRDVISFLCRKDVLPHTRFLVVFLLLSTVSEKMDPLLETFSIFWQELRGTEQILCICENEDAFTCWKDLIETRYGLDIKKRSIYELSFAEVNGTILSLLSDNRKSSRFLPCGGGSKVMLKKKVETSLDTLNVLCVNQCEGGNEDKSLIEETFYKGGKVSWWNFYFSEQPGSMPFIKRDKFDFIVDTILPLLNSLRKACVSFNLFHLTGCGGTTLGMHVLWTLKDKYRCAVLKDRTADHAVVAEQVVNLLMYETTEQSSRIPVLLMLDDFEEMEDTYDLQMLIEKECVKRKIGSKSPQVILLNCMMTEFWEKAESTEDAVFIGNNLSEMEQRQFEKKLEEIEKTYKNADTFYAFMIMKKNFAPEYIQGVARNTLKSFSIRHKQAQLIAVLALLNVYCKGATLSVSLCEEFLDLQAKPHCGSSDVKAGFGKFSTLVTCCTEEGTVVFEAVRMIHSSMAEHCLRELTSTYSVTKAEITDLLLTTEKFYECIQGRDKLKKDVHTMLVKRQHLVKGEDSQFSPLIQDISKETPGVEENVLFNAAKRFEKDAIIFQLLARYQYLKKRDFREAKDWAKNAKELSKDNSYIYDTSAQVIKHELKSEIQSDKEDLIKPEKLKDYLRMAQSATESFRETQVIAKKEATLRIQNKRDNSPYNTAGCLGEIQVAVIIIEILEKIPVFSSGNVRHDILSEVLSGRTTIQKVKMNDSKVSKHASYYHILQEFDELLHSLRYNMKKHFDFLDNFHVNLSHRFTLKDSREERTQQELFRCFQRYSELFCKMDSTELMKNKNLSIKLQIHKGRQFLEMKKADTHSGILNCLSNGTPADIMVEVVRKYAFILSHTPESDRSVRDKVNLIYANVVLSCVKPESQHLRPYKLLIDLLCKVLQGQIPYGESLALYFIAVAMMWPTEIVMSQPVESQKVAIYVSQMRTSFWNEMKSVFNGKSPVVHFFLGKKQGYAHLVHLREIERCVSSKENFASLWQNGKIWKHERVKELLCRVTGEVQRKYILVDTRNVGSKIELIPMNKSQLCGKLEGAKVSFVIGFSMKGPLAFDIY
ncbi:sterile alpha motif domain-containing protein 9-like [Esox lucius]|uniref:SAM domain-containing protein n=1 Tax=Esox lucius TaxID=8010 RepID=A0A6Q2ZJF0_ESOLU|nr:sterile alpha motif domain-containing protein 9-like [Esox lucius]XP_028969363.2 sterile alpha motif domain-containing protein 9-like [Esox lucius]XP_028969367.2 sterile alpha motif domain-containing protein 9-like [Esox lucius]XP_028969368.2 sterile alpha motif domain-containing protein 9-like [Esox lucius]XP_028969370.2 sterile alpha motif domain-containing protein 9-like [Esox lucius]XP_028969371.2 sterile alpha motif domain-containing protein 9-like [Esox lucius]XP_028969372.2 sterile 